MITYDIGEFFSTLRSVTNRFSDENWNFYKMGNEGKGKHEMNYN